jgi:hypothetical protein
VLPHNAQIASRRRSPAATEQLRAEEAEREAQDAIARADALADL